MTQIVATFHAQAISVAFQIAADGANDPDCPE
jgi:hypothetical protein